MPPAKTTPPQIAGLSLDGAASVAISAVQNRALCESLGVSPADDGAAHPSFYFAITQIGMKLSVRELCAVCDFDVDDGPLLAGSEVTISGPLLVETPYYVRGEIVSLVRKMSRKLGAIDVLEYRLRLIDAREHMALEAKNTWILPRDAA